MGPQERVWGYTGATGMVQGFSAGYFLWDLVMSAKDMDVHGVGSFMHAASALAVSMLGFVRIFSEVLIELNELITWCSARSAITTASILFFMSFRRRSSISTGSWISSV